MKAAYLWGKGANARMRGGVRRDGSPMRCPLVTITDTYRDQQGRSNHGRAEEE